LHNTNEKRTMKTPNAELAELVERICAALQAAQNNGSSLSLEALAEQFQCNATQLQKTFRSVMGISPKQYAASLREEHFKARLQAGAAVTEAMYDAGYGSSSRLYESASERLGMTPAAYKRGGAGVEIHYVVAPVVQPSALGFIIVAATDKGICSVQLGDTSAVLVELLHDEFPHASITNASEADGRLVGWLGALTAHIEGTQRDLSELALALDVRATAFQLRVWEQLRRIPYGETRSYSDVAVAIGSPSAVRAVARACASNPVALITPCHRVLRSGGELSGYRWGVERKRRILEQEGSAQIAQVSMDVLARRCKGSVS
jgi:AraC family transcriptional regulator, regulatory protein of adaptative response / methylated-DNA-[protein]-cysteine methyltransferase